MLNVPLNYPIGEVALEGQGILEVLEVLAMMVAVVEVTILENLQKPGQIPRLDSLI